MQSDTFDVASLRRLAVASATPLPGSTTGSLKGAGDSCELGIVKYYKLDWLQTPGYDGTVAVSSDALTIAVGASEVTVRAIVIAGTANYPPSN